MDFGCDIHPKLRGGCIAVGNFDGVHRGHRQLLRSLRELAAAENTHSIAVTFHPHPMAILRPQSAPPLLTTIQHRTELLRSAGVDHVLVLPVTPQLLAVSADVFFESFLIRSLNVRGIVEGENFRFGRDRLGGIDDLRKLCDAAAVPLRVVELSGEYDREISSGRIRRLIAAGDVTSAVSLLGRSYSISGTVVRGAERGRTIGFPTANLAEIATLIPGHGVYAGTCQIGSRKHVAAVCIGPNPTFGDSTSKVECHIDDFIGDLYDQTLSVELWQQVRPLEQFRSVDELIAQIRADILACRAICRDHTGVS